MFEDKLRSFNLTEQEVEDCGRRLEAIFNGSCEISGKFDFIAHGAFKEVYGYGSIVLKFCSEDNETEKERDIINAAFDGDLGDVFLPTVFIPIDNPKLVPLYYLDEDETNRNDDYTYDDKEHTWKRRDDDENCGYHAVWLEIQQRIETTCEDDAANLMMDFANPSNYNKCPVVDELGRPISYSCAADTGIGSKTWMQAVINIYGFEYFAELAAFITDYDISDLHNRNIGYYKRDNKLLPVIIDWLSW